MTEFKEGLFKSGGSIRMIPQNQSLSQVRNNTVDKHKNGGGNIVKFSFFRSEKHYNLSVNGDSNQVQIGNNFKFGE